MLSLLRSSDTKKSEESDEDLKVQIVHLTKKIRDQENLISHMNEGLLVVGCDERIKRINNAATSILCLQGGPHVGRFVEEVVRNHDLQLFIKKSLTSSESSQIEVIFDSDEGEKYLQVYGKHLIDIDTHTASLLIVINDISHIRRLENLRRDFVANVSHELKTPITAIQGFVETLLDGAVQDPSDANRFLDIIGRNAERLYNIIDNLLSLSRIEQEKDHGDIHLEPDVVINVLQLAVQGCEQFAQVKDVRITVSCDPNLRALMNASLLEQAVTNLLQNAIEYSPHHEEVIVEGYAEGEQVMIRVIDRGCGIEPLHLPRIFERFYRVDKARSRKHGGSGLGLAIVKHIAQTHGGFAGVISAPQCGSTFYLCIRGDT